MHGPADLDIFLLIEVADASLQYDRKRKLAEYARYGIAEVWIVNLRANQLEVFRCPLGLGYEERMIVAGDSVVSPAAFPDIRVPLAAILR